jgi:hypothetical protein
MRPWPLEILAQSFEKRMANLAFGWFRSVHDLGQEFGLDPYAAVSDLPDVGLCLPDQRLSGGPWPMPHRSRIVALSASNRLPGIYHIREYPADGGLMSYGASLADTYRQLGVYAGKVLRGTSRTTFRCCGLLGSS